MLMRHSPCAMFLIFLSHDREPTPLPSGDLILVGRGDQCDIRLEDPSASRVHCRLLSRGGKVILTDAGSRWGTFVNGDRVTDCELQPGDEITVGETTLRLAVTSTPNASTLARPSQLRRGTRQPPVAERLDSPPIGRDTPRPPSAKQLATPPASPATRSALKGPRSADFIGRTFADCHINDLVARTRSGLVFRAIRGGESVALKLLHPETLTTETAQRRFLRAVDTVRGLRHPGLVALYDGGMQEGIGYSVSEFVLGENLAQMIPRIGVAGMLDWRTTLRIARDMVAALAFLESQRVVHRSITPQHILIRSADGSARLNDLLLSKSLDETGPSVTNAGETVGELPYLSPEQVGSGQPVDHRSDLYQLGATLYALLTGRPPFEGRGPAEVIQQILMNIPIPPTRYHLAIPPQLEGVVLTMLQKRPADRFTTASDLIREIDRVKCFTHGS